jgi:peptidoglycan/LPS O-acetylase OafA/YrhL
MKALLAARANLGTAPAGNIPCLDFLRSMAILLVITGHLGGSFSDPRIQKLPFVLFGWTGVDLFFVLSGFLIGGQLWKELDRSGTINVGRFIVRRGFRIWPLYFCLVIGLILRDLVRGASLHGYASDIFFVSNYFHCKIGGGWSLSTEEQFYLLFPAILYVASRFVRSDRLVLIPTAWLFALPLMRWLAIHVSGLSSEQAIHALIYSPLHTHSDGLAAGVIVAWIGVTKPAKMKAGLRSNVTLLVSIVFVAFVLRNYMSRNLFAFSALALMYGGLTFVLLRTRQPVRLINWPGFYVLSRLSYGIYLNHFGVLEHVVFPSQQLAGRGAIGYVVCWCVTLTITSILAFLTFAFIELPFLNLRNRWTVPSALAPTPNLPVVT